jgi:hypothetical protein
MRSEGITPLPASNLTKRLVTRPACERSRICNMPAQIGPLDPVSPENPQGLAAVSSARWNRAPSLRQFGRVTHVSMMRAGAW